MTTAATRTEALLAARRDRLGPSLSVSYHDPLEIVRGEGQYLFDRAGERYLDCVNNVCHVGHCEPRVVAAGQRQLATLNTNTRYLHESILEYARRLTATLPAELSVCYFVNSGSEANELALRLARTHTGARDVVVLEHGYHGHTQALIDLGHYKFAGRGGQGAPETTHVVPLPDPYRGPHKGYEPATGAAYARHVEAAWERALAAGRRPAAFLAEAISGCGGQVVFPAGFLAGAYTATRAVGGVCIADEVQVGFGRVGRAFWGFELQGVVPDIVTLGKPIGNGHPMAAVVTTPEIAASFANGMEYFNTFGGNPVSCAIGLAVLDVIQEDGLQRHALAVGERFMRGLRDLGARHPLVGDVRGEGLFIGLELVRDRATLEPAATEADELVEALRHRGILLSTDGPHHNVVKIKPPLVFTHENADEVVEALDDVLATL
ncbi:MAG: aminotransferase class III-fold pyridoxal phosphate-dependent enzyme [Trueperaceae bacterium]|nr:aminotransferase class III-fold pyridoxal phosphate-dependent enzyme [Trueperaceae bacterium]